MRSNIAAAVGLVVFLPVVGQAQEVSSPRLGDRLSFNAGVTRTYVSGTPGDWLRGFHLRAEYHLVAPERVLGLSVNLGGFWTLNQRYSGPTIVYGDGTTFEFDARTLGLELGVTGSVTPWPRGPVSPYVLLGMSRWQEWSHGGGYYGRPDSTATGFVPRFENSYGTFAAVTGVGLQVRIGGRLVQFEYRQVAGRQDMLGVGTALRF